MPAHTYSVQQVLVGDGFVENEGCAVDARAVLLGLHKGVEADAAVVRLAAEA